MKKIAALLFGFILPTTALAQPTPEIYGTATNLVVPWALGFAPDGRLFINERPGRVRVVGADGQLQADPVIDLSNPAVVPDGQAVNGAPIVAGYEGGLCGLAVDPNFATNGYLYVYYTYGTRFPVNLHNRVARLVESAGTAVYDATILDSIPGGTVHDGGRIKVGPDQKLYATVGDSTCLQAQRLDSLGGKILRMNLDGTAPDDNPFVDNPYPYSLIYAYGNRNPEGLAWNDAGQLWETEHGPTGDCGYSGSYDEVNIITAGGNYGWPCCIGTTCRDACGTPPFIDPARFWRPESEGGEGTAAPAGAAFYNGSFFFGMLGFAGNNYARHVHQITTPYTDEQVWFRNQYGRIRDVVAGPDGYLYFANSNRDARGTDALQPDDDKILRVQF